MGQYYMIMNLAKREYLHPHHFGDGLKLMEFANSSGGTMTGLALLLATSNGRGGGDFRGTGSVVEQVMGRWRGDPIAIVGDYCDSHLFSETHDQKDEETGKTTPSEWLDISLSVLSVMLQNSYTREDFFKNEWGVNLVKREIADRYPGKVFGPGRIDELPILPRKGIKVAALVSERLALEARLVAIDAQLAGRKDEVTEEIARRAKEADNTPQKRVRRTKAS